MATKLYTMLENEKMPPPPYPESAPGLRILEDSLIQVQVQINGGQDKVGSLNQVQVQITRGQYKVGSLHKVQVQIKRGQEKVGSLQKVQVQIKRGPNNIGSMHIQHVSYRFLLVLSDF